MTLVNVGIVFAIVVTWLGAVLVIWSVLAAGAQADERIAKSLPKPTGPTGSSSGDNRRTLGLVANPAEPGPFLPTSPCADQPARQHNLSRPPGHP